MRKEEKSQVIDSLVEQLANNSHFYLTDVASLTAEKTSQLRRLCFKKNIKMLVVKNSLLQKAMERSAGKDYQAIIDGALKGSTAIMFSEVGSDPAKLIKQFREKNDKPLLKAAFVEESTYIGDNQLERSLAYFSLLLKMLSLALKLAVVNWPGLLKHFRKERNNKQLEMRMV